MKRDLLEGLFLAGVFVSVAIATQSAFAQGSAVFQIDFTNNQLTPSHWRIQLQEDGSGQFDADGGNPTPGDGSTVVVGDVHRTIRVSSNFASIVFTTARQHQLFAISCESRLKVAFQGNKKLSYTGPEGSGSCEYNYSKDKQIQSLGDSLLAVETTLLHGARLEKLLQHDRLGIDKEMEGLAAEVKSGSALEVISIRDTLAKIANDPQVLDRARRKARLLLEPLP